MLYIKKISVGWFLKKIINASEDDNFKVKYHKGETLKDKEYVSSKFMGIEQSNTSIIYNENLVLKFLEGFM